MSLRLLGALCMVAALSSCSVSEGAEPSTQPAMAYAFFSIDELQASVASGELTFDQITTDALTRIHALDDAGPMLNAIVAVVPKAHRLVEDLSTPSTGILDGIPVVLKANIDTVAPLPTHAGSLAIHSRMAAANAPLVDALEAAGAVVIGKANMSEWANFRSINSSSGWSSVGGQTRNPHVLDRNPCGSSSGSAVAVAAGLVPLAIGTETLGSIVCPAGVNGIVGLKPTLGLISQAGLVPIAASQDTAGPMARSVKDVALALQAMAMSQVASQPRSTDYVSGLKQASLAGLRIGVWRAYSGAQQKPEVAQVLDGVVELLETGGATTVDPVGLYLDLDIYNSVYKVMLHEFGIGIDDYLGRDSSLAEVMRFNEAHADVVMPWFGQEIFTTVQTSRLSDAEFQQALEQGQEAMRKRLDDLYEKFQLDFVIAPTNEPACPLNYVDGDCFVLSSAGLAAISGRPAITLPAGQISGLPVGVTLVGKDWQDAALLAAAHALEQQLPPAPRPKFLPSLEN